MTSRFCCLHATVNSDDDYSGVTCCLCDSNECSAVVQPQREAHREWLAELLRAAS